MIMLYHWQKLLLFLMHFLCVCVSIHGSGPGSQSTFSPDLNDFDAYGIKVAANDVLTVLVQPSSQTFIVQFAPYNYSSSALVCAFGNPNIYVYSVAIGQQQTTKQFVYNGEDSNGNVYVGLAIYQGSPPSCMFNWIPLQQVARTHQEFYVIDVDSTGSVAYGMFQGFFFTYQLTAPYTYNLSNFTADTSFMPHAMNVQGSSVVVAGYTNKSLITPQLFRPIVYLNDLFGHNIASWYYTAVINSWQADLTNMGANLYAALFDMSVDISETGGLVLIGIQSVNTVFVFSIDNVNNPTSLTMLNSFTNGNTAVGFGKAVAFLDSAGMTAAILSNTYTILNYQWVSSQVQIYSNLSTSTSLISVWPNSQQTLGATTFNPSLLNIISTPTSLVVLDISGNVYIILPSGPGLYSQTNVGGGLNPSFSSPTSCMSGMYKNVASIIPCSLCPAGTKNPGGYGTLCEACTVNSFCPLGSSGEVSQSVLDTVSQASTYPISPDSTIFDEILIENMFSIGSTTHCLLVSPAFWALMGIAFAALVLNMMIVLNFMLGTSKFLRVMKVAFRHADLVREGEMWIGGMVSIAIVIFVSFAIYFSASFYGQYPIETASDSMFACDVTIRNAQFSTDMQSLGTPPAAEEQPIFDMMNNQTFILNIRFVNTLFTCASVTVYNMHTTIPTTITPASCTSASSTNTILSISIALASLNNNIMLTLNGVLPVGAIIIGMTASESQNGAYLMRELNFSQPFYQNERMLAPDSTITLQLTKVINITEPIDSSQETEYNSLFIPTFLVNMDQMLIDAADYAVQMITQTSVSLVISETPYYINNRQSPIAKSSEIIFHNILFLIVCLEMSGLVFLIFKLFVLPFIQFVAGKLGCNITNNQDSESKATQDRRIKLNVRARSTVSVESSDESQWPKHLHDIYPPRKQVSVST